MEDISRQVNSAGGGSRQKMKRMINQFDHSVQQQQQTKTDTAATGEDGDDDDDDEATGNSQAERTAELFLAAKEKRRTRQT